MTTSSKHRELSLAVDNNLEARGRNRVWRQEGVQTWAAIQEEWDVCGRHARINEVGLRLEVLQVPQTQPRDLRSRTQTSTFTRESRWTQWANSVPQDGRTLTRAPPEQAQNPTLSMHALTLDTFLHVPSFRYETTM